MGAPQEMMNELALNRPTPSIQYSFLSYNTIHDEGSEVKELYDEMISVCERVRGPRCNLVKCTNRAYAEEEGAEEQLRVLNLCADSIPASFPPVCTTITDIVHKSPHPKPPLLPTYRM